MRVIGKGRIPPVEFDEFMDRTFEYIELRIKHDAPLLHKILYKCPPDELVLTRRLLSIIPGYLISRFVINLFNFSIFNKMNPLIDTYGTILLTLLFVQSVQFRAILSLITLILMISTGGIFIYLGLFRLLLAQVLPRIIENLIAMYRMQSCLIKKFFLEKAFKIYMGIKPILALISSGNMSTINDIFVSLARQQKELQDMLNKEIKPLLKSEVDCLDICNKQGIYQACYDALYPEIAIFATLISESVCSRAVKFFCKEFCTTLEEYHKNETKTLQAIWDDNMQLLNSKFGLEEATSRNNEKFYQILIERGVKLWPNVANIREDVYFRLKWSASLVYLASIVAQVLYTIAFFNALFQSAVYLKKYLKFLNFDNLYIDRYFRRLDLQRKNANKIHFLPLRKLDGTPLLTTWSLTKSYAEKFDQRKRTKFVTICLLITLMLVYLNQILIDLTSLLYQDLQYSDHDVLFIHSYDAKVIGGKVAQILNKLVQRLNFNYQEHLREDLSPCAIYMEPPSWKLYEDLMMKCLLILFVHFTASHLRRLRHLTCDFYFYRQSKRRVLFLYNRHLKIRKRFIKIRKIYLEKIIKMQRLFSENLDPVNRITASGQFNFGFFAALRNKQKRCFICQQILKKPFVWCDKSDNYNGLCGLVYCLQCSEDIQNKCINCIRPTSSGTSSATTGGRTR